MPFWNIIRNIFTGGSVEKPSDEGFHNYSSFRNPIWQNDDDDDDVDDFRYSRGNIDFHIFHDPIEMTRYFESQMNNLLNNFTFGFHNKDYTGFSDEFSFVSPNEESLRNKMLKPDNDTNIQFNQTQPKLDTDLDGKITPDNFPSDWNSHEQMALNMFTPYKGILGKFVTKEYIHKSDGTLQQKQTVRDSDGNEETTVLQKIGDKMYSVTTKRDKNGVETKTESFINMDENELQKQEWVLSNNNSFSNYKFNYFPWEQFFKPNIKL